MLKHWNSELAKGQTRQRAASIRRSQATNGTGAIVTGVVLLIVVRYKFAHGAYLAIAAMLVLFFVMRGIRRHYAGVADELVPVKEAMVLPRRNHAIVLVSTVHQPTMKALAYVKATRPHDLTAVTVSVNDEDTQALLHDWDEWHIDVPLTVLDSPYREITRPILAYVRRLRLDPQPGVTVTSVPHRLRSSAAGQQADVAEAPAGE